MDKYRLSTKRNWRFSISVLILSLVLRASLDATYFLLISRKFGSHYTMSSFTMIHYLESYCLTAMIALIIPSLVKIFNPGRIVIHFCFAFLIIPMLSLYGCGNVLSSSSLVYLILIAFLVLLLCYRFLPHLRIKRLSSSFVGIYLTLSAIVVGYVFLMLVARNGIRVNWDFYKVYEVREGLILSSIPFIHYLLSWCANIISQVLIVFSLHKRAYSVLSLLLLSQVFLYGITNFKSFLLAPVLVILVFVLSSKKEEFLPYLLIACITCVVTSMLLYYATDEIMFPSVFTRRLFLTPAKIHFWYFDFFSLHPHTLLSNSILSGFINYPYELPIKEIIASEYTGRDVSPNVGYLGDAYAHFGFVGMLFFSAMLAMLLKITDSLSKNMDTQLSTAMLTMPAFTLVNSGLLTTLMTHGFMLGLLSIWVFNRGHEK